MNTDTITWNDMMQFSIRSFSLWVFLGVACASAKDDQPGTFLNPDARSRPRFRYWLPDASVDGAVLAADIKSAGEIGAGGIEFLPFFNYGGDHGPEPVGADWSTYAFGSPAYRDLLVDALTAHKDSGMFMDIAIGPNQGQGVPAEPTDEGLQWDLIPYTASVPSNGSIDGLIPGWEKRDGALLAVVSARVLSEQTGWRTAPSFGGTRNSVDNSTGQLDASFDSSKGDYLLFSFYQRLSGNRNVHFEREVKETFFDYGSFAVDHNSARGAMTVINFWENQILDDEVRDLIKAAGNYMWEDSIEVLSNVTWSPSLPGRFEERFGYSLMPYLPLISWGNNNIAMQRAAPGSFRVLLNTKNRGDGYINDFRTILTEGYIDYLQTLRDWANDSLGIQFSTQPSYGFPQDMLATISVPDVPECESLTFHDSIDAYRQFSGIAHLAGKKIISNEVGAVAIEAYRYDNERLIWSVNRAVAGGVNQFILHGQSYTGNYYGTTWPGYTAFLYLFSEMYSNKQPSWKHGLEGVLQYIARLQFVQRQGQPRVDVAILNKQSANNGNFPNIYPADDLQSEGWTYSYLTDSNLDLPQSIVKDGVLAPESPAWKAFIIESSQNVTTDSVERVRNLARAGLPIIIAGTPGYYPTKSDCSAPRLARALASLRAEPNVYSVAEGEVTKKLRELGLSPRIQTTNKSWYSTWRADASGTDYVFFFNDGAASNGTALFSTAKKPFALDPWTGERTPVAHYIEVDGTLTMHLSFAANETKVFSFEGREHTCHVETAPGGTLAVKSADSSVVVHSHRSGIATLSSKKSVSLPQAAATIVLDSWTLVVSHWERPSDLFDVETIASIRNTTRSLSRLESWTSIPGLEDTSGVGYYNTTFDWPTSGASGAYISFPPVAHALTVFVNGQRVPTLDQRKPQRDITPFLRDGSNDVLAVVPSTMWNYIRTILKDLRSGGVQPSPVSYGFSIGRVDNGIIGTVEVIPYEQLEVRC
ncbi:hypothetical protein ACHAQA_010044 [Verticillium albo-atrum]